MKYGYLSAEELDRHPNLQLPPNVPENITLLARYQPQALPPQAFIGCAEYRVKEWNGLLYPKGIKETQLLEQYARQFNTMEMNGTHYKIYAPEQIRRWAEKAGDRPFQFLPKFPQLISHQNNGPQALERDTHAFLESVAAFGNHIGPLFLQMSESYSPHSRQELYRYLATLPDGFTYFVELRHPHWFTDSFVAGELYAALRAMGIGLVITDTPGHREVCHGHLTIPKAFIRFVGKHSHPTTQQRADGWMQRLKLWLDAGLQELYFIVHTGLSAPVTAQYVVEQFNKVCGFQLSPPKLFQQEELF